MSGLFRCRAACGSAAALVATLLFATSSVQAQDNAAATPAPMAAAPVPMAAAPAPMVEQPLFKDTHVGIETSFGADSPAVFLAGNTGAVLWGVGVIFNYDGNLMADKTHANLVLSAGYMVHNRFPFAMGPEVDYVPQLAPSAFDSNDVRVGWTLWYAPWSIPAVIGTAVLVDLDFVNGKKAVVSSLAPVVRIVFGFH
jgi:hypothetical protein